MGLQPVRFTVGSEIDYKNRLAACKALAKSGLRNRRCDADSGQASGSTSRRPDDAPASSAPMGLPDVKAPKDIKTSVNEPTPTPVNSK